MLPPVDQSRYGYHLAGTRLRYQPAVAAVKGRLGNYELTIPLIGEYQLENAAVAVGVIETLMERGYRISPENIADGFARVDWPGRLQVLKRHPFVVADGAHNPYSAAKLREALKKHFTFEHATLIIGTSSDKDISGIVSELAPIFNRVIVTRSTHPRAQSVTTLVAEFKRHGIDAEATDDISDALPLALSGAGKNDLICVTGSLFVVAGAIEQISRSRHKPVSSSPISVIQSLRIGNFI